MIEDIGLSGWFIFVGLTHFDFSWDGKLVSYKDNCLANRRVGRIQPVFILGGPFCVVFSTTRHELPRPESPINGSWPQPMPFHHFS